MNTNQSTEELSTIDPRLAGVVLRDGAGAYVEDGMCAMQAVAWLAGEVKDGHLTDAPACACRVIRGFVIRCNDRWTGEERQALLPLIPLLVGSVASADVMQKRRYFFADFAIRTVLPWLCDKLNRRPEGERLRALTPVSDRATAELARAEARSLRATFRAAAAAAAAAADAAADDAAAAADDAAAAARKAIRKEIVDLCVRAIREAIAIK
jgi:hypothetical protein